MKVLSPLHGGLQRTVVARGGGPTSRRDVESLRAAPRDRGAGWMDATERASTLSVRPVRPWRDERGWGATPSGRGADGAGQALPRWEPGKHHRQVQHDPPRRALDPHGQLE